MSRISWKARALVALVSVALLAAGAAEARDKKKQRHGAGKATVEHRFDGLEAALERYEPAGRAEWQKPGRLLLLLAIAEGDTVADIGTGTGFMIPTLSGAVGEVGRVYAVDIERELVEYAAAREDLPYDNVVPVVAATDDPGLPAGSVDVILIVNTWHHIDRRDEYLERLVAALAPGGRIAIVDWVAEPTAIGPPLDHRLPRERVIEELSAQLALAGESIAFPYQYMLLFMRESEMTPAPIGR